MLGDIVPHAITFRSQYQRHRPGRQRLAQCGGGFSCQTDSPIARLGNFFERPGQVDHPHPRHNLQSTRGGLGHHT